MRIVYFTHSLASCWNHGNAHFLRGLLRELVARGHQVTAYEPADGWSRQNLVSDHGKEPLVRFQALYPELEICLYRDALDLNGALRNAELVIVHEWTDPWLVNQIGTERKRHGHFVLLFHDTHHRAISDPAGMTRFDLSGYDGILAFGQSLAEVYERAGWGRRVFVLHEAADTRLFRPPLDGGAEREGIVWIGNWGDGERSDEIVDFVLRPARDLGLPISVHGVRYPPAALSTLAEYGANYCGWLANANGFYSSLLPGIPTIRVFEALSSGIPLLSAFWQDSENLFRPGKEYLLANSEDEMRANMRAVVNDPDLRRSLVRSGLESIHARHTCAHRADELLKIAGQLSASPSLAGAA